MRKVFLVLLLGCLPPVRNVLAQEEAVPQVSSPLPGQVVQGLVVINGTVDVFGFSSYELSFAYAGDEGRTWFLIQRSAEPVSQANLGTWDTTVLTDGDYDLRLRVFLLDGSEQQAVVEGLRVRNYTPAPTEIPTATPTEFASLTIPTPRYVAPDPATATPSFPTPTPLPANPVELDRGTILAAVGRGGLAAVLVILALAFLLRHRRE